MRSSITISIHRFCLFIFCGLLSLSSRAEMIELKGKITQAEGKLPATVILHSYADESFSATAIIAADGSFSYMVNITSPTLFNLRFLKSSTDILLTPKEKQTELDISLEKETVHDISIPHSIENDAFKEFRTLSNSYDLKLNDHFVTCTNEDSCDKKLDAIILPYQTALLAVEKKYPATYTVTVLCKMKMPNAAKSSKGATMAFRQYYFDKVPFGDSTILNTPVFKEMLHNYVGYVKETKLSKEQEFINYITAKMKSNPVVLRKGFGLLYDDLFEGKMENMLGMLMNWYIAGDNAKLVNNAVVDVKIRNINPVMPGQPFKEAIGPDTAGVSRSLKDMISKSKCTLLLFWSSECSHCREEMPAVKECYEKYHNRGFNVFAVSLENDHAKWKEYIKEQKLGWTNIILGPTSDPNAAREYIITTTPTLVLIDRNGKILHRFTPKTTLEKHIKEALE